MLSEEQKELIKQFTKECSSEYYKMFCKKKSNKHYANNRERFKKQSKLHRDNNKEYYKKYRNDHKKENRNWQNIRWKTNIKYKLNKSMSYQINFSLKGNKAGRRWEMLLGYNINILIKHLKKTIPMGYCWQDYLDGKLHIDHIIPISVFNYETPEHSDFKRCWALKNLRLLSAKENIIKSDKLFKPFQPALKI